MVIDGTGGGGGSAPPHSPSLISTETQALAAAASIMPSPLKSPTATSTGYEPTAAVTGRVRGHRSRRADRAPGRCRARGGLLGGKDLRPLLFLALNHGKFTG